MNGSIPTFENSENSSFNNERPLLIKVLCILSWIGSGFQIFVSTLYSLFINQSVKQEMYQLLPNEQLVGMYKELFYLMDNTSIWYLLLYIANIAFVYMIWSLKKRGFYGYVIIQILILFVPFIVKQFEIKQLILSSFIPLFLLFYFL